MSYGVKHGVLKAFYTAAVPLLSPLIVLHIITVHYESQNKLIQIPCSN